MKNNFIKKIDNTIISQMLDNNTSLLDAELKTLGYNLSEIEEFSQKKFKSQFFLLKGLVNKQKDIQLLERASTFLYNAIDKNIEKPVSYLKSLIHNNDFQIQYRNLESLTIDEIKEIIRDQNLLELLEKLDNEREQ